MTTLHIEVYEDGLGKNVGITASGPGSGLLLAWALERFAADKANLRYKVPPTSTRMLFDTSTEETASASFVVMFDEVLRGTAG